MPEEDVPEIEADDAEAAVAAGALLLDVREPEEWVEGHAPAAVHVPMREVQDRLTEVPKDRLVVAICRSGARSRAVAALLQAEGSDVVNTIGGMQAWQAFGLDVVTDDGSPGIVA